MALEKQIVELVFASGLETKADAKSIPLGKLLVAQNCVFTAPGKLQKRNGYTALTTNVLGGGSISTGAALFTRSNELCMTDTSRNLYSYDVSNTAWASKGKMPSVTATVAPLANPQYTTYAPDMAVAANGLQCCVYELYDINAASSQKKGIGYTIVDSTTGQIVAGPGTVDATASSISPHVVYLGTNFVCYYIQGDLAATAGIYGKTLDSTSPSSAWSAATQLTSGTTSSACKIGIGKYQFDVCVSGTNAYLSFNARDDSTTVFKVTSASPMVVAASTNIAGTTSLVSTVIPDVSGDIAVAYVRNTTSTAVAAVYDTTLAITRKAATVIDTPPTGLFATITGVSTGTNAITWFIGTTVTTGTLGTQYIRTNTMAGASYVVGTAATVIRSLGIAAKAFLYSSAAYLPAWFGPNTIGTGLTRYQTPQNQIFLIDSSGNLLARTLIATAGTLDTIGATCSTVYQLGASTVSSNTVVFAATSSNILVQSLQVGSDPLGFITGYRTGQTLINSQYGVQAASFNFSDTTNNYIRGQLANEVHTSGGILQMYDGQNVVEHGFLTYPYGVTAVSVGSGGSLGAGTYGYIATFEWMDGQGQLHRSAPSTAWSVTTVANDSTTVTGPTLRLTAKTGVMVQIYRTEVDKDVYYQISNFNAAGSLFNDKTADSFTWTDTQSDTAIRGNPQLYTTSGRLDNAACNPAGPMTVHRNRLCVVDSTSPNQIWISQLVTAPAPVEFSGGLIINIDPKGGPITALASLDDKLIIFKSDRIFMILGQGPDSTGNQNDFTDAILVSADTGCAVPKSVVVVPDGIMFQSPKGIYQLNRALQVSYIGAPVEVPVGSVQLIGGVMDPAARQVVWGLASSVSYGSLDVTQIAYDYFVGQWVTNGPGVAVPIRDLCIWQSALAGITSTTVSTQRSAQFYEQSTALPIGLYVKTGWIKLSGLQGFQRVWRVLVLGEYKSPHTLTISLAFDYQSTAAQTNTFTVTSDPNPYQFRVQPNFQKCEAIQITIYDTSDQTGTEECMNLSGLALEVGMKRGARKLVAAQSG